MARSGTGDPARFGKYEVVRKIASGGMADVYLCRLDSGHGFSKKVAVKAISPDHLRNEIFREMFIREARLASTLSHPNIVSVFDFGQSLERNYLVMEYVEGCSLASIVARMSEHSVSIPRQVWRYWMESLLSGLGYLHSKGIVHRDVTPVNILVSRGGGVKISDFGISGEPVPLNDGRPRLDGKLGYMAPEIVGGEGHDHRSDLFSAAVTGAELLVNTRLFRPESIDDARRIFREFDPEKIDLGPIASGNALEIVLRKALSKYPANRYADSDSFVMAIESAIPSRGTRREVECFWDSIHSDIECETTRIDLDSTSGYNPGPGQPGIVRESIPTYGRGVRGAVVGLAAAAVVAAGTGMLYRHQSLSETRGPSGDNSDIVRVAPARPDSHVLDDVSRGLNTVSRSRNENPAPIPLPRNQPAIAGHDDRKPVSDNISVAPASEPSEVPVPRAVEGVIPVIQALPWARVYDGNRYLGDTPIRSIGLSVGNHALRFVNEPLGVEQVYPLTVKATGNSNVIVNLMGSGSSE